MISAYNSQGGTIGTGLFIGSGAALAKSGPVGTLIGYIFVGTVVFSVMISLGEMATYIPVAVCPALIFDDVSITHIFRALSLSSPPASSLQLLVLLWVGSIGSRGP